MSSVDGVVSLLKRQLDVCTAEGREKVVLGLCKVACDKAADEADVRDSLWRLFVILLAVRAFPFEVLEKSGCPKKPLYSPAFASAEEYAAAIKAWNLVQKERW